MKRKWNFVLYLQEFVYHTASYCNASHLNAHADSCTQPCTYICANVVDCMIENWNGVFISNFYPGFREEKIFFEKLTCGFAALDED